jgi:hypothetical protein
MRGGRRGRRGGRPCRRDRDGRGCASASVGNRATETWTGVVPDHGPSTTTYSARHEGSNPYREGSDPYREGSDP